MNHPTSLSRSCNPTKWTMGFGLGTSLLLTSLLLGPWGCSSEGPQGPTSHTEAFSNRPQKFDQFIAILRLKEDALLTHSKVDEAGVRQIDPTRQKALEAEQAKVISELEALSPDLEILYRYRLVLNGLAVVAPRELEAKFRDLSAVAYVEGARPLVLTTPAASPPSSTELQTVPKEVTSVTWIEADKVHQLEAQGPDGNPVKVRGQGTSVGIIDTGIDYLHGALGGSGDPDLYKANDPTTLDDGGFPNLVVTGGIDLVGDAYNAAAPDFALHIPKPDADPLDLGGHGTHVAGTVAGQTGLEETYEGVAPSAKLHAIKVFGAGSTSDAVVIAALEYAADPNKDLKLDDQLDVVNMSLGSSFGTPLILYSEAIENLSEGGTVVVASAGNSGDRGFIVGAPSTAAAAISVAASIDGRPSNWTFPAVAFDLGGDETTLGIFKEASFTKPLADFPALTGKLVHIGLADQDLSDGLQQALAGNIALIGRGGVPFVDKLRRAATAGAIAAVVYNNADGAPIAMGGNGSFDIPGLMIEKSIGDKLVSYLEEGGQVEASLVTDAKIEKPELVDTLASFTSRGPRSLDGLIKPEVAAPGYSILSAAVGTGKAGVELNGTSMAAPHVAGVVALLRQLHPEESAEQVKSRLVSTAKTLDDADGEIYPISLQGAGLVQALQAAETPLTFRPATLSLGEIPIDRSKTFRFPLTITNQSSETIDLERHQLVDRGLNLKGADRVTISGGTTKTVDMTVNVQASINGPASIELDGFVFFNQVVDGSTAKASKMPILATLNRTTNVTVEDFTVRSTSAFDSQGVLASLELRNEGRTTGLALPFNFLGRDERKRAIGANRFRTNLCDLEAVGYRLRQNDQDQAILDIGIKLYSPISRWNLCELSLLIDGDGDQVADQELVAGPVENLIPSAPKDSFMSLLMDASKMRSIRAAFEMAPPDTDSPSYASAVVGQYEFTKFDNGTIAVASVLIEDLDLGDDGLLHYKLAVQADGTHPEADDYFLNHESNWDRLSVNALDQAYKELPKQVELQGNGRERISIERGFVQGQLVLLLPNNRVSVSTTQGDDQFKLPTPTYQP